ncbi:MarR family transcriptional regulator [Candidatus Woesearchaeota archaeon]|nr:MarR family transcriptional regulator [Candidatus Woesearchaeota archaeon]
MGNKRLGLIIIGLSILFSLLLWAFNNQVSQLKADSCAYPDTCDATHEPPFLTHGGIAVVVATLSLGTYLLFFEKSHKTLIKKLKEDASIKSSEERFNLILMGLNEDEKKVLTAVKEQDGITQHTLGIRTNLHKSKLSIIVGILEEKGLIKKEKKGKTNQLFLRINLTDSSNQNKPL